MSSVFIHKISSFDTFLKAAWRRSMTLKESAAGNGRDLGEPRTLRDIGAGSGCIEPVREKAPLSHHDYFVL
jgi:hypothetical protein